MIAIEARDLPKIPTDIFRREPPALHASLPDGWHREARVRVGDHFIDLDETRLPRLEGVMGAVNLLRQGKAEISQQGVRATAANTENEPSAGVLAVKVILEMAGLAGGATAIRKGKGKNGLLFLGGLGLAAGSGIGLAMDLTGCGPTSETPPAIMTEAPATAMPIETSTPSLGNEVLTGTPSAAPEAPAPVGGAYPSEVSGMTDPKVYSYGGVEGRANMNEYTRAMFDRYIAEMGPERGRFLTGATVEELYRSFDNGYDFKLYTTDTGLVWLVQSKSDGSFLVPKNQDGQMFRDLQLSYDYLFQSGAAVPVGTDNFDFQKFQANRVGFVGAWPVLVSVDAQNVPVSWINMEQGGATAPIVLASTTATPEAAATAIPDSRVELAVGGEAFRVTTDVLYADGIANIDIDPAKAQKIGELLVYTTDTGRLIWNENMAAWTPEFQASMDYTHPELSPSVPFEAYYDGSKPGDAVYVPSSIALSDQLYVAEHPNLIAPDASRPAYRVTLAWSDSTVVGYELTLRGPNSYLLSPGEVTVIDRTINKPFAYFGVQQTVDKNNNTIYVIKKANLNPTPENTNAILTTNQGFDQAKYNEWFQYPLILKYLTNDSTMTGELNPMFPYEFGTYRFDVNTFLTEGQGPNPHVARLLNTGMISMFDAETQQEIKDLYNGVGKQFDVNTNPMSFGIDGLPLELSNMILFTSVQQFR